MSAIYMRNAIHVNNLWAFSSASKKYDNCLGVRFVSLLQKTMPVHCSFGKGWLFVAGMNK